jgi:SAM-dependent methyltransferase
MTRSASPFATASRAAAPDENVLIFCLIASDIDRTCGRGGLVGTFEYDFSYADPDGHYDAIAILQGVAHSDDWPATARELIRVVKPGGPIVLAEINFGEPLIRKASEDLHLEYWLTKILAGRGRDISELP